MSRTRRVLSAPEQIVKVLKDWLLDGSYPPGARLPSENELAREFGVSRPTAREALKLLEAQHLVMAKAGAGGGYFAARLPSDSFISEFGDYLSMSLGTRSLSIAEVYEFRRLVEIPAAGLAAQRRTEEDVQRLQDALMDIDDEEYPDFLTADLAFHRALATASHNQLLGIAVGAINLSVQPILQTKDLAHELPLLKAQLEAICKAVVAGSRLDAEMAMDNHLHHFRDTFG